MNKPTTPTMTHILIDANKNISLIQQEFNSAFPFLKLEFFKHKHGINGSSPKSDMITNDVPLNHLHTKQSKDTFEITEDMPVSEVEQLFHKCFGISAQVFRKSGRSWLETSVTDDWTLRRQNDEGQELSGFTR